MSRKFNTRILDTLLNTVEIEFKVPILGFGEIKFPVSKHAKEWWKNEKAREDLLNAISVAEQNFIAENPENKATQILHDFSLKNEEEFQKVVAELLNHLDEQKITWLMADKLGKGFERIVSNRELQDALTDYIPYLRDELSRIREFREVITYLLQKQIANTTSLTLETTQEIKDLLLEQWTLKTENQLIFVPEVLTDIDKLPEPSDFLPPGSRMPFYRNKIFTGRESDLIDLAKILLSFSGSSKNVVITQIAAASGMGGIGKTQLAVEFCYRYGKCFHGVHWINARDANLEAEIAACGLEMGLPNFPKTTPEQVFATLQTWKTQSSRLIVLDNLEDPTLLANWLPRFNGLHLLVTARRQQYPPDFGIEVHQLGILPRADSLALLRRLSPRLAQILDSEIDLIAERLGDLPLAIDLAGRYLNSHPSLSPEDYLKRLDAQDNVLNHTSLAGWLTETSPTKHETSLASTFLLSWSQLSEDYTDQIARGLFIAAGYLTPNISIPSYFFYTLGMLGQQLGDTQNSIKMQQAQEITDEALLRLNNIGLLDQGNIIHPLISEFAKLQANDTSMLSYINSSFQILINEATTTGLTSKILDIISHIQSFLKHIDSLEIQEKTEFYRLYATYLYHAGQYRKSIKLLDTRFDDIKQFCTANRFVNTLNVMGLAYREIGELKKSLAILSSALEIATEKSIEEGRWAIINNLGMTYFSLGQFDEAIVCYTTALAHKIPNASEETQKQLINILSNLSSAYETTSQFDAAIKSIKNAIELAKNLYGSEHPITARCLGNMGLILRKLGKPDQAKPYFLQAYQIYNKTLESDHPDLATAISNLGLAYQDLGEDEKALPYFEKALEINEKAFGRVNQHVAKDLHNLGTTLVSTRGDYESGIKLLQEAIDIETKIYGENHNEVSYDYRSLAFLYIKMGDFDKARRMSEKALYIDKVISKSDGFSIGEDFSLLGLISFYKQQYKRAVREFSEALRILEKYFPADHVEIINLKDLVNQSQRQYKIFHT